MTRTLSRLVVNDRDPRWLDARVLLDGVEQRFAVAADSRQGYVDVLRQSNGKFVLDPMREHVVTDRVYGRVAIICKRVPRRAR